MGEAKQTGQTATGRGPELGPSAAPAQGGHSARSRQCKCHADSHRGVLVHRVCGWGLGTDTGLVPYPSSSGWRLANRKGSVSLEMAAQPPGPGSGAPDPHPPLTGVRLGRPGFLESSIYGFPRNPGMG